MNKLRQQILKNSKLTDAAILSESMVFNDRELISTPVPMINVALSGSLDGGLLAGHLMIAGPSKHFKTAFGLLMASSFLTKHEDGVVLFYDSEFGSNQNYFKNFNVDPENIVHCPVTNVEELKTDIINQLKNVTRDDNLMIFIDSIGNLASLKEVQDAEEGKSVADMTRAKQLKSVFRMVTPHLTLKNIPMVTVNHTYKEISMFPKDIVSGGTGSYYSANDIWIVGRRQDTEGKELQGYEFIINIEKSRLVKEKSKIPISVSFEDGINKYSGLFDLALDGGFIVSPSKGWYHPKDWDGTKYRRDELDSELTWKNLLNDAAFQNFIEKKYRLGVNV
jgi:hypothetical protein